MGSDETPRDTLSALTDESLQMLSKEYLVEKYCPEHGISADDLLAKTVPFHKTVKALQAEGIIQFGIPIKSRPGPKVKVTYKGQDKEMLMFASNDYLNLSSDPRVHEAIRSALDKFGVGAGSSRVGTGYSDAHRILEEKLAKSFGKEAAIVFPTGYDAIASTMRSLLSQGDRVIVDGSAHACILEGAQDSGAKVRFFKHNDMERLEATLKRGKGKGGGTLIVVEGAYSMDGDIAKIPDIVMLAEKYGARVMVDEAHSIGVHGKHGHGACEHYEIADRVDIIAGTFSKSLGATGGFVAARQDVVTYINYISKKIMFSAAFPPVLAQAVGRALEIMETDDSLRTKLWDNINHFAKGFDDIGAKIGGRETASIPVLIGRDEIMFHLGGVLFEKGIFTYPVVYPTTPRGKSLFRMAVQTGHSFEDLDYVVGVFKELLSDNGLLKGQNPG